MTREGKMRSPRQREAAADQRRSENPVPTPPGKDTAAPPAPDARRATPDAEPGPQRGGPEPTDELDVTTAVADLTLDDVHRIQDALGHLPPRSARAIGEHLFGGDTAAEPHDVAQDRAEDAYRELIGDWP